jgi:MFS family permease
MPADGRPARLSRNVFALGLVSFFNDFSSDMIYPLLPAFLATTLGAGPAAVGIVEGVAEATAAVGKGVFGWISDRASRRKPFVLAGYAVSVAARPLIALAGAWWTVGAIRFADRIGKGVRTAPRDALVASSSAPGRRGFAFGFQRAMDNAGALAGPLAAALLLKTAVSTERAIFALSLVPGLAALLVLALGTREAPATPAPPAGASAAEPLPRDLRLVVAVFTLFALANSTDAFLLLRAGDAGVPLWAIPLLWAGFSGAKAVLNTPAGALADRVGRIPSILLGWGLYAAAYVGFGRAGSPRAIAWLFLLYAGFYALTEGAERALVAELAGGRARGKAFGVFHMSTGLAALPASILFGLLWKSYGPTAAFDVGAAVAGAAAALLLGFQIRRRKSR